MPSWDIGRQLRVKYVAVVRHGVVSHPWIRRRRISWNGGRIGTVVTGVNGWGLRVAGRIWSRSAVEIGIGIRNLQDVWSDARGTVTYKFSVHCLVAISHSSS